MNRREMLRAGLGLAVGAAAGLPVATHASRDGVAGQSVLAAAKAKVFKQQWLMKVYSLGGLTPNQIRSAEGLPRYIQPRNDGLAGGDSPHGPFRNI